MQILIFCVSPSLTFSSLKNIGARDRSGAALPLIVSNADYSQRRGRHVRPREMSTNIGSSFSLFSNEQLENDTIASSIFSRQSKSLWLKLLVFEEIFEGKMSFFIVYAPSFCLDYAENI